MNFAHNPSGLLVAPDTYFVVCAIKLTVYSAAGFAALLAEASHTL